jgi:hypothetical protein
MNQEIRWGRLMVLFIAVASVAGIFYMLGQKSNLGLSVEQKSALIGEKQPMEQSKFIDWQTYKDDAFGDDGFGISFQYPKEWELLSSQVSSEPGNSVQELTLRSPENQKCIREAQARLDSDEKAGIPNTSSGSAYFFCNDMELSIHYENIIPDDDPVDRKIGETIVGGNKAIEYWIGGYGSNYGLIVENNGLFFRFDFKGCGSDECIKNRALSDELKQVLKSLKFVH